MTTGRFCEDRTSRGGARTPVSETIEISGHLLLDSGVLARVLDDILEYDGEWAFDRFDVDRRPEVPSHAVITVTAEDDDHLQRC